MSTQPCLIDRARRCFEACFSKRTGYSVAASVKDLKVPRGRARSFFMRAKNKLGVSTMAAHTTPSLPGCPNQLRYSPAYNSDALFNLP
jgi:hypothetical protein